MRRVSTPALIALAAAFLFQGTTPEPSNADETVQIRIATLAPSGSSWMKVFDAWNRTVAKQTDGALALRFYAGGSQGDERDFVRKMRAGQLDGAVITTTGLGQLVRPVLVLALPGLIDGYVEMDQVRADLNERFDGMFSETGYTLIGWGDAGRTRLFSVDKIERPVDLRRARPWAWKDDPVFAEFLHVVGANAIRLGLPEVYVGLQTRTIDALASTALAAIAFQWHTKLKHVTGRSSGIIVGATVIRKDKFDALTPEQQQILKETGLRAHAALNKKTRQDDDDALATMVKRGAVVVDIDSYLPEWQMAEASVRDRLAGRVYSRSLLQAVEQATH